MREDVCDTFIQQQTCVQNKEFPQINKKKREKPTLKKKEVKFLNRYLIKKDTQMANKLMKRYSTFSS